MLEKPLFEVMLSSTFHDLEDHRKHVTAVLKQQRLHAIAMEDDASLSDQDMIDASLAKVEAASGYMCIVGKRYGQVRLCPHRNPHELSLTELEFEKAVSQNIPITVLVMEPAYPVGDEQNEFDSVKREKLQAFRQRAGRPHRVTADFDSWEEFLKKVPTAVADLRHALDKRAASPILAAKSAETSSVRADDVLPPAPPTFHMVKPFTQGHAFVGREKELERIARWATGSNPVLVFEAIGGMGKSMVTYRWAEDRAPAVRPDWAGRLWYSFYEEGANMNDFCVHALAYIERRPPRDFLGRKTRELEPLLVKHLNERSWLIVMDGLERVLVAYNRIDKAQLRDDEAIADPNKTGRDPNRCVHPADDHLLQSLATARASKFLVSTRNMPTVLLNVSDNPIGGVEHERLTGLEPEDAERMMREAGVKGQSQRMRRYLETHFECHPLMVGVVAGLANNYVQAVGNFDRWLDDPQGADAVDLTMLKGLVAKRDHILKVAYEALDPDARKLLGLLAFFSQGIPGDALVDLNPRRPPRPEEMRKPKSIEETYDWELADLLYRRDRAKTRSKAGIEREIAARRATLNIEFEQQTEAYRRYEEALAQWRGSPAVRAADSWLGRAVAELQERGLIISDRVTALYDLHPMVRGFVRHELSGDEGARTGRAVADHARSKSVPQYDSASSLGDLAQGTQIVTALTLGAHYEDAAEALIEDLRAALLRLDLFSEWQALLRPFFAQGWDKLPDRMHAELKGILTGDAAICFSELGDCRRAEPLFHLAIARHIADKNLAYTAVCILNYSILAENVGNLARSARLLGLHGQAAEAHGDKLELGRHHFRTAELDITCGDLASARKMLDLLIAPTVDGFDEQLTSLTLSLETLLLEKEGHLSEIDIESALTKVRHYGQRLSERQLLDRRSMFLQSKGEHQRAAESFEQSIAMARAVDTPSGTIEARYAVSLVALGRRDEACEIATRVQALDDPPHVELAQLYLALDEREMARQQVRAGYRKAWADGPPHAFHWDLENCRKILKAVGEAEPKLPPFDPTKVKPFDFESDFHRLIEKKAKEKRGI